MFTNSKSFSIVSCLALLAACSPKSGTEVHPAGDAAAKNSPVTGHTESGSNASTVEAWG